MLSSILFDLNDGLDSKEKAQRYQEILRRFI